MIVELAQHIANLLLENDCVIVPEFGGFIVHYMPASRVDEENLFLPPYRTVGFNSRLKLNDGLLIQSYMKSYDVSYPEALRMVEDAVEELQEQLSKGNEVSFHGVGNLSLNIGNEIDFKPAAEGVASPSLYGFDSFEMRELAMEKIIQQQPAEELEPQRKHNTVVIRINTTWLRNAAAVAAAVVLFFILSTPVDNTYVEPENYASLGNVSLFDQIRSKSVATSLVKVADTEKTQEKAQRVVVKKSVPKVPDNKVTESLELIPVQKETVTEVPTVKETVTAEPAPAVTKSEPQTAPVQTASATTAQPRYHIIVASVTTEADGEKSIQYFAEKGYPGATLVKGDGRVRIAISSFSDWDEANAKLLEFRKLELFQNAWLWTSRNK